MDRPLKSMAGQIIDLPPKLKPLDKTNPPRFQHTAKRINDEADVQTFLKSRACRDISHWITQLNRSLCPRHDAYKLSRFPTKDMISQVTLSPELFNRPRGGTEARLISPSHTWPNMPLPDRPAYKFSLQDVQNEDNLPESVRRVRKLLQRSEALLAQAPAEPGPAGAAHRFGNPAFRKWFALLQDAARDMMEEELAIDSEDTAKSASDNGAETETESEKRTEDQLENQVGDSQPVTALDELVDYFMGSWGSAERLDYGTGHELSFLAFLGGLWKLDFFADGDQAGPIERAIVLGIFEPYLVLMRKIILLYRLEPAGSRGVWGLDDHFFLPYIFGSAQLTRPIRRLEGTPTEGSLDGAPQPSSITDRTAVATHAKDNMYFSAIAFINEVKSGPLAEHSPLLYDVSGITDGWGKINKGMLKMYKAEILSKFPVMQHFRFGTLFSWEPVPPPSSKVVVNRPRSPLKLSVMAPWEVEPPMIPTNNSPPPEVAGLMSP